MTKNKEKVPSSFSSTICMSHIINHTLKFINLSKRRCGPKKFSLYKLLILDTKVKTFSEIRTRDFCVTYKYFTVKLLARSNTENYLNYLNLSY